MVSNYNLASKFTSLTAILSLFLKWNDLEVSIEDDGNGAAVTADDDDNECGRKNEKADGDKLKNVNHIWYGISSWGFFWNIVEGNLIARNYGNEVNDLTMETFVSLNHKRRHVTIIKTGHFTKCVWSDRSLIFAGDSEN